MTQNIVSVLPELLMLLFGFMLIIVEIITSKENKYTLGYFGIVFILFVLLFSIPSKTPIYGFSNMLVWDYFSYLFFLVFSIAFIFTMLNSVNYNARRIQPSGEYYLILFLSIIGMMFMASALDLAVFYVGLETMSISLYILAGYEKDNIESNEAGIKYFIIGAFSSAIFLFGLSYIYGYAGSTKYHDIANMILNNGIDEFNFKIGLVMMLAGFAFKISAVPFHMWAPDVYTGSPTPIAGFMTVAPKAAAFAGLIRFAWISMDPAQIHWQLFFVILAILTMTYGNLVALVQKNIKRMLAYSAISHAGYMLVAFVAANDLAFKSIVFYMIIYSFMNIGAFAVLSIIVSKENLPDEHLENFAGLAKKNPLISLAMLVFMFSLAGIPPLAGFVAKFYAFMAAIKAGFLWLAIIAIINSAIGCYYYIRVVYYMYFKDVEREAEISHSYNSYISIFCTSIIVILLTIFSPILVLLSDKISLF
ncbi:MAG: NADH-quinone oxidoreductase subunit N [Deferribacterota bacterium]|nr:NADH-quinone oxidoreductase subunit N [Deferribacterota bacterium]